MKKILLMITAVVAAALSVNAQVTPPSGIEEESWSVTYTFHYNGGEEDGTEPMKVVFDGDDVYFDFPNPITGNTWMKGTRNGQIVTFPKGQLVGNYGGDVYYMGQNDEGLCDIEFYYEEAAGVFMLNDMYLLINSSLTVVDAWGYFSPVMITRDGGMAEDELAYVLTGQNVNPNNESQSEDLNEDVKVRIDGSSFAVQGLSGFDPTIWLTGTISDGVATFAKRQSAGSYNDTALYFIGYDGKETDITFSYDEATGVLVAQQYILCISAGGGTYQMLQNVVLSPKSGDNVAPQVVTPPADLQASPYVFTGLRMLTDDEGNYAGTEEVNYNVKVGFYNNNSEVYIQGLCQYLPEAWVKGTVGEDFLGDKPVTFAAGQYYGQYGLYPLYMVARYGNQLTDMVFNYDEMTKTFTNDGGVYLVLNLMANQPAPIEIFVTATLRPGTYTAIESVTDNKSADDAWYSQQGVRVAHPSKGIFIKGGKKVVVK